MRPYQKEFRSGPAPSGMNSMSGPPPPGYPGALGPPGPKPGQVPAVGGKMMRPSGQYPVQGGPPMRPSGGLPRPMSMSGGLMHRPQVAPASGANMMPSSGPGPQVPPPAYSSGLQRPKAAPGGSKMMGGRMAGIRPMLGPANAAGSVSALSGSETDVSTSTENLTQVRFFCYRMRWLQFAGKKSNWPGKKSIRFEVLFLFTFFISGQFVVVHAQ